MYKQVMLGASASAEGLLSRRSWHGLQVASEELLSWEFLGEGGAVLVASFNRAWHWGAVAVAWPMPAAFRVSSSCLGSVAGYARACRLQAGWHSQSLFFHLYDAGASDAVSCV
jgi:hypothetical protein